MFVRNKIFSLFLAKMASWARAAFAKQNAKRGFFWVLDVWEPEAQSGVKSNTGCDYHLKVV